MDDPRLVGDKGTPPSSRHALPPDINPSSTPIKKKTPLQALFSTYTRFRHPTINALGNDMARFFTGPMPVKEFLSSFLPTARIPDYHSAPTQFRQGAFNQTLQARTELEAYAPFVTDARRYVPNLDIVDTHTRGDKKVNGFGFEVKPDVSVYSVPPNGRSDPVIHCDIATLDMHIEFKWSRNDDPFLIPKSSKSRKTFLRDSERARDTLGQISAYVAAQLSVQSRTHVFSILVVHDIARIIRWDREGAIVSSPIAYNDDPSLVEFLNLYSQAPPELRGIDTSISPATEEEATSARTKLKLPPDTPMFSTTVPKVNVPGGEQPAGPEQSRLTIVFPPLDNVPSHPVSRATRASPAYYVEEDRVVFLKDSWRISIPDVHPEGEIYKKLNASHVEHVPLCLACGDVDSWDEQKTQTLKHTDSPWARSRRDGDMVPHTHYRLVLDLVGEMLSTFTSSKELVQAVHDAMIAHQQAYALGILHRDVSVGNIIIVNGRGYLIDWDLAKSISTEWPRQQTRTGTWQFMSARLVEDSTAVQTVTDDIESAFWVLLWTVVMYSPTSLSLQHRTTFVRGNFETLPGVQGKRSTLVSQTIFQEPSFLSGRESLYKLLKALADLFKHIYLLPEQREVELLEQYEPIEAQPSQVQDLLRVLMAYRHRDSVRKLGNHEHIIDLFASHLELDWPADDGAEEQELIGVDCFGAEFGKVILLKSKHMLETVEERSRKRSRIQTPDDDLVSTASDDDLVSDDATTAAGTPRDNESESVCDMFGSSLTSLPSSP